MEGKKDIYTPIMTIHPPNLLNIPLPSKCWKSRAIWLLFKMSQIMQALFDETNDEKNYHFPQKGKGEGGSSLYKNQ